MKWDASFELKVTIFALPHFLDPENRTKFLTISARNGTSNKARKQIETLNQESKSRNETVFARKYLLE